jgi:hypothetical protein
MPTVAPIHAPRTALSSGAGLRARVTVAITAAIIAALAVATPILLLQAAAERRAIEERAGLATAAIAHVVEREAAASLALLDGLASTPSLHSGDHKGLYEQFAATKIAEGAFLSGTTTSVRSSIRCGHSVHRCHISGTSPPRPKRLLSGFTGTAGAFPGGIGVSLPERMSSSSAGVS